MKAIGCVVDMEAACLLFEQIVHVGARLLLAAITQQNQRSAATVQPSFQFVELRNAERLAWSTKYRKIGFRQSVL